MLQNHDRNLPLPLIEESKKTSNSEPLQLNDSIKEIQSDPKEIQFAKESDFYDDSTEKGVFAIIDSIMGLPPIFTDYYINCTFAVFDGSESRRDLEFVTCLCEMDGKAKFQTVYSLKNILPIKTFRIILEFRAKRIQSKDNRELVPLGWTSFDLFNDKLQPDFGNWLVPLYRPPVDFNITTQSLYTSNSL